MKSTKAAYLPGFKYQEETAWNSLEDNNIDTVNWADFSYQPKVSFKIVHDGEMLYVKYDVCEKYPVRAEGTKDQDPVYEDSCVEFFILKDSGAYQNFECNSKGVILSATGKDRNDRTSISSEQLSKIIRHPSGVTQENGNYIWSMIIGIPFASIDLVRGKRYPANFYKCGDLTEKAHFLSWSPINTPQPFFHCPEFFGSIELE